MTKQKNKHYKIKLPVWFVVMLMFMTSITASVIGSMVVTDARMKCLKQSMADVETMYIQETGKYPGWFLEWLNTEYLPKESKP